MSLPPHSRPEGVNTASHPSFCRVSRPTLEALHELKRRTGRPIDHIIYALAAEALHAGNPA